MNEDIFQVRYGLGRVIGVGWKQYWLHFSSVLCIVLIVYVPVNVALSFVPVEHLVETQGLQGFRLYMKLIQLSEFLIGVLATMALAALLEASIRGNSICWQTALRHAFARWGASLGTGLLSGLIILGLLLLLIVPGIIWGLYYSLCIYVVALRGLSGKEALDYSKAIVKGQWWRVLGYLVVIGLLGGLASILVSVPFMFTPDSKLLDIASSTLCDLASALSTAMWVVFFLNNDYLKNPPEPAAASGGPALRPNDLGASGGPSLLS
jgi:hypothetical protein